MLSPKKKFFSIRFKMIIYLLYNVSGSNSLDFFIQANSKHNTQLTEVNISHGIDCKG